MPAKKIAITINTAWNIWNFRIPMINALREAGFHVICFAPEDEYTPRLKEKGIEIYSLFALSRKGKNPVQDIMFVRELIKQYREHNIDLALHFTIKPNIYGSLAASRLKIPSISIVTGLGYSFLSDGLMSRITRKLYKYAFARNTLTIFQNPDDHKEFIKKDLVQEDKSTIILGSGIDVGKFPFHPIIVDNHTFLFIGRLLRDKGVMELLEGFSNFARVYPKARLILVGDTDSGNPASLQEEDLATYYNHKQITFMGFQSDVKPFIIATSSVILPSYREGVPRTLLEALAIGRPVLASDVPGCREVVKEENGFLFEAKSVQAVTETLEKFYLLTQEEKTEMGKRSRGVAERYFSMEVINKQYLEQVKLLLNRKIHKIFNKP